MVFHGGVRSRTAIAIVDAMRCIASGVAADTTPILIMFTPNDTAGRYTRWRVRSFVY